MAKQQRTLASWLLTYAKDLLAVGLLFAMGTAGMSYFATAADVEKKFNSLKIELKIVSLEARKARVEDELFRLRSESKGRGTTPQILRYEAELRDVSQRLRDLERGKE